MCLSNILKIAVVAGALASAVGATENPGNAEAGKAVFKKCKACHQIGEEAESRTGPQLNSVFGRKAAGLDDFRYSRSLVRAGNSGLEWHFESLSAYIENPRAFVPGTRMGFHGLKDPDDRADVIAYLRIFSDNPQDIPEAGSTAGGTAHSVDLAIPAIQGDYEYGKYLSSECTTCHQLDGGDEGIPSIVYWPDEKFVIAMHAYRNKQRPHPVMQMIAGRLSNEEIAALAAYFKDPE